MSVIQEDDDDKTEQEIDIQQCYKNEVARLKSSNMLRQLDVQKDLNHYKTKSQKDVNFLNGFTEK